MSAKDPMHCMKVAKGQRPHHSSHLPPPGVRRNQEVIVGQCIFPASEATLCTPIPPSSPKRHSDEDIFQVIWNGVLHNITQNYMGITILPNITCNIIG